jgi:toxin-antitoxin system PIN domain toxin
LIAVDSNILVYAHRRDSSFHQRADEQVTDLAESRRPWTIPWPCVHEFIAVVTHPRVYSPPSRPSEAIAQADAWFQSRGFTYLGESSGYWEVLRQLLGRGDIRGPRVHDARVAAICLLHGVREIWSADRDFRRFQGLRVVNPLVDG